MTNEHHIPTPEQSASQPEKDTEKTLKSFASTYDHLKAGFVPTKENGRTWQECDGETDTINELLLDPDNPHNQMTLEGRWPQDERLDDARRDALHGYFLAEHGEPSAEELDIALRETRRTILDFQHPDYSEAERRELTDGIFGSTQGKKKVLDFIEDRIADCNVFPDDPEKMKLREQLRTARFKLDSLYHSQREGDKELRRTERRQQEERDRTNSLAEHRAEIASIFGDEATGDAVRAMSRDEVVAALDQHEEETGQANPLRSQTDSIKQNTETISSATTEQDLEFARLQSLGFGDTPEAQKASLLASENAKEQRDRTAKERRDRLAKKREEKEFLQRGQKNHEKSTLQKRDEEEAMVAVFEALQAVETPQKNVEQLPPPQATEKPSLSKEEREKNVAREKLVLKKNALHIAVEILRLIPRPIKEQLLLNGDKNNPLLSSAKEAFENTIDISKVDINRIRSVEQQLREIGVIGPTPAGPGFWQEVENPSGSGSIPRLAERTRELLSDLINYMDELQKEPRDS